MRSAAAVQRHQVLVNQARAAYRLSILRARESLADFIELCGRDEDGNRISLHFLHRCWIWHVNYAWSRGKHALIMAPFNSGKTSSLAVPICGFLVGQNPQTRIKIVCAGDGNAKLRLAAVKGLIESYEYRTVFPGVRPGQKWDTTEAFVIREGNAVDPTLHARGVLTEGIGGRADVVVFDDVCTQKNTEQEANRHKITKFGRGTWLSRLDGDAARALGFATPWAQDDFSADLKNDPNWVTLVQKVRLPNLDAYEQEVYGAGPDYAELFADFVDSIGARIAA